MLRFAVGTAACMAWFGFALAAAQKIGDAPEAKNMTLVGQHDLQARSAYQPIVHRQGERWIAYIGHHGGTEGVPKPMNPLTGRAEFNGTSILDVTDPRQPQYLAHIPGEEGLGEGGGGQMARMCPGSALPKGDPGKFYLLRTFGNSAHETWDVTDPARPTLLARIAGIRGTHKNWWECDSGIAYLVSGIEGWRTRRMTQVYDLSDPAKPVHLRDFGLPGQQPGASGATPTELHGPISTGTKGNRVYFGYGTNKSGVVQIVDRQKLLAGPFEPSAQNLLAPQIARFELPSFAGAHTAFPLLGVEMAEFANDRTGKTRDFIVVVNESLVSECQEARQMVYFVDITDEKHPFGVATYNAPEGNDFCARGGRFGAHSSNENMTSVYYRKLMFFAWFNGGVRMVDVRNPYAPREAGYFIPAITEKTAPRCVKVEGRDRCKVAIQTNNVEVDERGYIYIVDRANTGLHILEPAGEARALANLPGR